MRLVVGLIALIVAIAPSITRGDKTSALINEQLDKLTTLTIQNATLPAALDTIAKQTGVPIKPASNTYDLLPWGEQTTINAKIENQTLRAALEAITKKLGLQTELKEEYVELQPMPPLARIGRRSTVAELEALDLLASTPLALNTDHPKLQQLLDALDQKLVDLKSPFAIENRLGDKIPADKAIAVARNATMYDALEAIAQQTSGTWYPWGKSVLLVPKEDQIRNQLMKTITIRYDGADVQDVLNELSRRANVDFNFESGAVARIPQQFRTVKLTFDNATIKQALESLASFTGLAYAVNEKGVYIWNPTSSGTPTARDPIVGSFQMDDGTQIFITQSKVPDDVKQYVEAKRKAFVDRMRKAMKAEGFQPTTKPATQPTTDETL
jgi:hypothetical protein